MLGSLLGLPSPPASRSGLANGPRGHSLAHQHAPGPERWLTPDLRLHGEGGGYKKPGATELTELLSLAGGLSQPSHTHTVFQRY